MNFLNLEYFLVAAEELNFTRAAKKLYISQQSLSSHIAKLEEYFGAPLFDRASPLALTAEGECLKLRAGELLSLRDETRKEIADLRDFKCGELVIGTPRAWGRLILPNVLPAYNRKFPSVKLQLREGITNEIELALHRGEVDLSIGFMPDDRADIESECLCKEKILLLVPDQVLAEQYAGCLPEIHKKLRENADIRLLRNCPFLIMDESSRTGMVARSIFRSLGISPKIVLESRNLETMLALCFQNMGLMFCPEVFVTEALQDKNPAFIRQMGIYSLPYENTEREIAVNYRKDKYLSQAAKGFITLTRECMKNGPFEASMSAYTSLL